MLDIECLGLSSEEVNNRIRQGQVNKQSHKITKTYKQIFLDNTMTFFNFINIVLLSLVLLVGSFKNILFILVIVVNTLAGIIQEIRAKKTLDKLTILTVSKVEVIREGQCVKIAVDQIVLNDILILRQGDQVPSDAKVIGGSIEVNEALLTGESDSLIKKENDELFSGSFVTAGLAYCEVVHVGKDNYMEKITEEAKVFKRYRSQLNRNLDRILKIVGILIIPVGAGLFLKQFFISQLSFRNSILQTVAALLGMIPEGLVLLTSIALTIGVMRLVKRSVLVQELSCMETLACVDVLCLDKTGTLTEGKMVVEEVEKLQDVDVDKIMGNLMRVSQDENVTAQALKAYFNTDDHFKLEERISFSSERKYSGATFEEGTYLIGAKSYLLPDQYIELDHKLEEYAKMGYRLLILVHQKGEKRIPLAIIKMSDVIRVEAKDTLEYFEKQEVSIKVISGDDPITVSAIAMRAGVKNSDRYIDATHLKTIEDIEKAVGEYDVFGRVSPVQKKEMVMALKKLGHTVAMTGDGINDVLAFKQADVSIAMSSGSEGAKRVANIVLLSNDFSMMPHIVNEGRRVINNIRFAASMFLIKTFFSVLLSIQTILFGQGYPFAPIQLSIISSCAVGIPTFLMTQESNFSKVQGKFFKSVFKHAVPTAITIVASIIILSSVAPAFNATPAMISTVSVLITGWHYLIALERVYSPLSTYRKIVIYTMKAIYLVCILLGQEILELTSVNFNMLLIFVALVTFGPLLLQLSHWLFEKIALLWDKHGLEKRI